jgi:hypothetical protein
MLESWRSHTTCSLTYFRKFKMRYHLNTMAYLLSISTVRSSIECDNLLLSRNKKNVFKIKLLSNHSQMEPTSRELIAQNLHTFRAITLVPFYVLE